MAAFNAKRDFSEELRDVLEAHTEVQKWAKAKLYTGIDPDDNFEEANNYYHHLENGVDVAKNLKDSLERLVEAIDGRKLDLVW